MRKVLVFLVKIDEIYDGDWGLVDEKFIYGEE